MNTRRLIAFDLMLTKVSKPATVDFISTITESSSPKKRGYLICDYKPMREKKISHYQLKFVWLICMNRHI